MVAYWELGAWVLFCILFFPKRKKKKLKRPKVMFVKKNNPSWFPDTKGTESRFQYRAVACKLSQWRGPQHPSLLGPSGREAPRGSCSTCSLVGLRGGGGAGGHLLPAPKGPVPLPYGRELTALWGIYKMRTTYRNHRELTVHSFFYIYLYLLSHRRKFLFK